MFVHLCNELTELISSDSVNVYVVAGRSAVRLSRLNLKEVEDGKIGTTIECTFPNPEAKPKKTRKQAEKKVVDIDEDGDETSDKPKSAKKPRTKKAKKTYNETTNTDDDDMGYRAGPTMMGGSDDDRPDMDDEFADENDALADLYEDDNEDDDPDDGSSDRENGWKVVRGSASGKNGLSSNRAISLSDSEA